MIAVDFAYRTRKPAPVRLTAAGVFWIAYFTFVSTVLFLIHAAGIVLAAGR